MLGYNVAWASLQQRYRQRALVERDAKKMALLGAGLSMVGPLTWTIPVMGARLIFSGHARRSGRG